MSKEFDHEVKLIIDDKEYDLSEDASKNLLLVLGPGIFIGVGNNAKDIVAILGTNLFGLRTFCYEIAKEGKTDELLAGLILQQFIGLCHLSDEISDKLKAVAASIDMFLEEDLDGEDYLK